MTLSVTPEATTPTPPIVIDTPVVLVADILAGAANLTIHVGEESIRGGAVKFKVISETMRLASPVWNSMLRPNGPFLENGAKEVEFPEDDASAFEIILRLLHHRADTIPHKLTPETLFYLAVLVDKYNLHALVRPYLPTWTYGLNTETMKQVQPFERIIFAAWIFGVQEVFEAALLEMLLNSRIDKNKKDLIWHDGTLIDAGLLPDGVRSE
jgi:hypothetical protein